MASFLSLLGLDRIFCLMPLTPPAFEGINLLVTVVDEFPCHTGTRRLSRSGTIKDKGLILWIFVHPSTGLPPSVFTERTLYFPFTVLPILGRPDIQNDQIRVSDHGLYFLLCDPWNFGFRGGFRGRIVSTSHKEKECCGDDPKTNP